MRRAFAVLIAILITVPVWSASVTGGNEVMPGLFYSEEELSHISFSDELTDSEREYYNSIDIRLITAAPAEPVYIYFGHSGLSVSVPGTEPVVFDYGTFSFSESFYHDFIFGLLYYSVSETYESWRLSEFEYEDRTTTSLLLDLTPEEKKGVLSFLSENIKPENRTYLYHYYKDNCATRIRDIYNSTTDGDFRAWAEGTETGKSYREWSTPYMSPSLFFAFFLNYLQGPSIDEPVTLYDACFLPDVLESTISEYEGMDPEILYETKTREPVPEDYNLWIRSLAIGAVIVILSSLTYSKRIWIRRTGDVLMALTYLAFTVMSSILVFMMFFTNHDVTYMNINALIISPFVIIPAVQHLMALRKEMRRAITLSSSILLSVALIALILQIVTPFNQQNASFYTVAFMLYGADAVRGLSGYLPFRRQQDRDAQDL